MSRGEKDNNYCSCNIVGDKLRLLNEEQIATLKRCTQVLSTTEQHCDGIVCGFMINLNGGDKISASEINEL